MKDTGRMPATCWAAATIATAGLFFLLTAGGLEILARHELRQDNPTTVLLALYLASWSYVAGIGSLALLSLWRLTRWIRQVGASGERHARIASEQTGCGAPLIELFVLPFRTRRVAQKPVA